MTILQMPRGEQVGVSQPSAQLSKKRWLLTRLKFQPLVLKASSLVMLPVWQDCQFCHPATQSDLGTQSGLPQEPQVCCSVW